MTRRENGQFAEGNSGGGRNKKDLELEAHARLYAKDAIDVAVKVMLNTEEQTSDRLKAAQFIVERAHGKPKTQVTVEGGENALGIQIVSAQPLTAEQWASKHSPKSE